MFDVHRRDIMSFDNYMDLKKPGFGGPSSAKLYRDASGKKVNKDPKLAGFQRVVDRHPAFGHEVYNPTYKAMSNDLVYKQEKKKPMNYPDSYNHMGIPVVMVGKAANEGFSYTSFENFINEEMYGVNPMGEEQMVALRGKSDLDAIGDAEDKMMQMKLDWQDFFRSKDGKRVDYLDADGDLLAYVDIKSRKLHVMPDAAVMPELPIQMEPEERREEDEEEIDDMLDAYERPEEEEKEEEEFTPEKSDTRSIEKMLKSFETEDDADYYDED